MKLSQRLQAEREYVETLLGSSSICECGATLWNFADACTADLCDPCRGFLAIEAAKQEFAKKAEAAR